MKRILTIIGARPQIIKAAALSRAIREHFSTQLKEDLLHTGQHYDQNMSEVFFEELGIPQPVYNLNVGSGTHGQQTAQMISGIEKVLLENAFDAVVVYGDTNSTLAGALAASKIHIPVIHIEAGLRSFNKKMPEELNRITCDHMSTLLFSPTHTGVENLQKEGIVHHTTPWTFDRPGVFHCGDIMYDNSIYFGQTIHNDIDVLSKFEITEDSFGLCTIHRDTNTDNPDHLSSIIAGLLQIVDRSHFTIVLPLHPRTKGKLTQELLQQLDNNPSIKICAPLSFIEMVQLESKCNFIITDSGGVQKEAYFFKKPCIILREQTEWVELVENGNAILAGSDSTRIVNAYEHLQSKRDSMSWPSYFGDGKAAYFICSTISDFLGA